MYKHEFHLLGLLNPRFRRFRSRLKVKASNLRKMAFSFRCMILLFAMVWLQIRVARALSSTSIARSQTDGLLSNPWLLDKILDFQAGGEGTFPVINPAQTAQIIAHVPIQSDILSYIDRASDALADWRDGTTAAARGDLLREWGNGGFALANTPKIWPPS